MLNEKQCEHGGKYCELHALNCEKCNFEENVVPKAIYGASVKIQGYEYRMTEQYVDCFKNGKLYLKIPRSFVGSTATARGADLHTAASRTNRTVVAAKIKEILMGEDRDPDGMLDKIKKLLGVR